MPRLAVCPQQHVWSLAPGGGETALTCPVCGEIGAPAALFLTGAETQAATLSPTDVPPLVADVRLIAASARRPDERRTQPPLAVPGYEMLRELGRGGMGVVYLARHRELKRLAALKMILPGALADPDTRARFRREAEAVARLQHPAIVQIHEIGEHEGRSYLALEYVDGDNLAARLAGASLAPRAAAALAETLARAMQFAHEHGIVHRDLTPRNILLARSESPRALRLGADAVGCEPKITDFGLAKELDGDVRQTQTGVIMGTPSYMSPEQAHGRPEETGPATDIHAIGAVLYECLTGRPPFLADTKIETLRQVIEQDPAPPSRLQHRVPRDLETICLHCLQKDPHKRYASAQMLADDLRRFLDGEPIQARPVSMIERATKWARRHPAAAALLTVSVLASITLLSGSMAYSARVRGERDRAENNFRLAMRAVDEMLTEVGEEQLAGEPRMEEKRRALLAKALGLYREFLQQKRDDQRVRLETAQAYRRMGDIFRLLGQHGEAVDAYEQAADMLGRLRDDAPRVPTYRQQLAYCHNYRGEVLRIASRQGEAEAAYQQARQLLEALSSEWPGQAGYQEEAASTLYNLGILCRETKRGPEAEQLFRQAIDRLTRLGEGHVNVPATRQHLARAWLNLGTVIVAPERFDEAKQAYETANALLEPLAQQYRDRPDYRYEVGVVQLNLGNLLARARQLEAARMSYRNAQARFRELAADFPKVPSYRQELANAHNSIGGILVREKKQGEAIADFDIAAKLLETLVAQGKGVPAYLGDLGMVLGNLGLAYHAQSRTPEARAHLERSVDRLTNVLATNPEHGFYRQLLRDNRQNLTELLILSHDHAAAAASAKALVGVVPDSGKDRYVAACFLARCVSEVEKDKSLSDIRRRELADVYAEQSMQMLHEAIKDGFNDAGQMARHRDQALKAIAARADFQALFQRVSNAGTLSSPLPASTKSVSALPTGR